MTLGRGLESLIPPQQPYKPNNQPQDSLGDIPQPENQQKQVEGGEIQPLGADTSHAEHPAGSLGLISVEGRASEPREKKPEHSSGLSARYSGSDRQ